MANLIKFQFNKIDYDMEIIDRNGEKWVPAKQVGEALGIANIRNLIKSLRERGELKDGMHIRTIISRMVGDTQAREITILSYKGVIRIGMRSDGKRAIAFRDWAEGPLYEIMTTGSYTIPGSKKGWTEFDKMIKAATGFVKLAKAMIEIDKISKTTGPHKKVLLKKVNEVYITKTGVDVLEMLEIENELSPFEAFIEQRMDIGPDNSVSPPVLFAAYKEWCVEMEVSPARKYDFYLRITTDLPVKRRRPTHSKVELFEGYALKGGSI